MKPVFCLLVGMLFTTSVAANDLIVLTENNRPFSYREGGEIKGFSTELVRELVELTGTDVQYYALFNWARAYKMAQDEANVLLYSVTRRPDRESLFKWVGPIAQNRKYLFRLKDRQDIQITSMDDAKQYVVGAVRDSSLAEQLLELGFISGKNLDLVADKSLNTRRMYANRIDLIANTKLGMKQQMRALGYDRNRAVIAFALPGSADYYIAFNRQTPDYIVDQFQVALETLKGNGEYDRLVSEFLYNTEIAQK